MLLLKASKFIFLAWFFIAFLVSTSVYAATISDVEVVDVTAIVSGQQTENGSTSGSAVSSSVVMQGNTFPNAKLILLKDGAVYTTLIANSDGGFNLSVNGLVFGNYQFSLYAQDKNGIESNPFTVNVPIFEVKTYSYRGIVLPPTIRASNLTIALGEEYYVEGYAAPGAVINLQIPGAQSLGTTTVDSNGYYKIVVTANLSAGLYQLRTKAQLNGVESLYSRPVQVLYYKGVPGQQLPPPPPQLANCVDYNKDQRVNLIDFSILLFWLGKNNPPINIDCNRDTVIDIKDFSILMYFWTG